MLFLVFFSKLHATFEKYLQNISFNSEAATCSGETLRISFWRFCQIRKFENSFNNEAASCRGETLLRMSSYKGIFWHLCKLCKKSLKIFNKIRGIWFREHPSVATTFKHLDSSLKSKYEKLFICQVVQYHLEY